MITKEVTLCGKVVTLAYCFATEIAYKKLSGEDMIDYAQHAIDSINEQRDPDVERTIMAIVACMIAYYDKAENAPVKDGDIMRQATPVEVGTAMMTIISMRQEFYHIPTGEPEEKQSGEAPKNE